METVLVVPIIVSRFVPKREKKKLVEYAKHRESMLRSGYTIKETKLVVFNKTVYAHYVMKKEKQNEKD